MGTPELVPVPRNVMVSGGAFTGQIYFKIRLTPLGINRRIMLLQQIVLPPLHRASATHG